MKVILTTLNSKFTHSSLALRYLKAYCEKDFPDTMEIYEYTINHHEEEILMDLYNKQGDLYCFSCYIFNIEETMKVVQNLKKVKPNAFILLGGPEVSYESIQFISKHPYVDYIIKGEGESTFYDFLNYFIFKKNKLEEIDGLIYRNKGKIIDNKERSLIKKLDEIPYPYEENFKGLENKILYYETTRGCPYSCQYCLSSTIKGVRFFSIERIKKDLEIFLKQKVKQVKFVDRTFNFNKKRTLEIWNFIKEKDNKITNFHFEIAADLIDEEIVHFLKNVRKGLFQFEIGVQSTNEDTLKEIQRTISFKKLSETVKEIKKHDNIHQHLDLIAGLPKEDYHSFKKSFNDVYALHSDKIQLGFLKLLKGSGLKKKQQDHGFVYKSYPPYEVLYNDYISYEQMIRIKSIENLLDKYYNSHRFNNALSYVMEKYLSSYFDFYEDFSIWWEEKGYQYASHKEKKLYEYLYFFMKEKYGVHDSLFVELLKFDLFLQEKVVEYPRWIKQNQDVELEKKIYDFYWNEENISKYVPELIPYSPKQRYKMTHIEVFEYDITKKNYPQQKTAILFCYGSKVSKKVKHYKVWL